MKNFQKLSLAAAVALALPAAASAATVVNGSFEQDPGVNGRFGDSFGSLPSGTGGGSWDEWETLPGWTSADGDLFGIEVQTENTLGLKPYDGQYYVELDSTGNAYMEQVVSLGVGDYTLSFAYSPRVNSGANTTNGIFAGLVDALTGTNFLVGAMVDGPSGGPPATAVGLWTVFSYNFSVVTGGQYRLYFDATTLQDTFGGLLDDVQINVVPVPAAGFLLLGALGGLAAFKRRKKA
jgi:hypothetical protein